MEEQADAGNTDETRPERVETGDIGVNCLYFLHDHDCIISPV